MQSTKNLIIGSIKNIEAALIEPQIIELKVYNSYYGGKINRVSLRCGTELYELKKLVTIEKEGYNIHKMYVEEKIDYLKDHEVLVNNGLATPLNVDWATKFDDFDERFYYEGNDLGNTYTQETTTFKVWAPIATKVKVEVQKEGIDQTFELIRGDKGVWSTTVKDDLEGYSYIYLLKISGVWREAADPYAYSSNANGERSFVIDLNKIQQVFKREQLIPLEKPNDAIIYEVHVRDFTISETSNIQNKGKFLGVVEKNTKTKQGSSTGLDYLLELGVTHVQFLPVYDFGSVDENNQLAYYNWGYDPVQYNVPEGSYATDANDPYARIVELQQMNRTLHEHGLRSIMDVVYNHMFDIEVTSLQKIVPNYYFRFDADRNRSNGSYCSNDLETRNQMGRKYVIDSCLRWIEFFGFDGFRFDLMGVLDIDTMNRLRASLDAIDPSIMLYGEGWHMPTAIPDELQASMVNYDKIPRIAHFNDRFRECIKGLITSYHEDDLKFKDELKSSLMSSTFDVGQIGQLLGDVQESINYVECHDNETLEDYMKYLKGIDQTDARYRKGKMAMTLVFIAQGIPFIHCGQEFSRTKLGEGNSYKSGDYINQINWEMTEQNSDYVAFCKALIQLRKKYEHFRLATTEEVKACVQTCQIEKGLFGYSIEKNNQKMMTYINVGTEACIVKDMNGFELVLDSRTEEVVLEGRAIESDEVVVAPDSVIVLIKK